MRRMRLLRSNVGVGQFWLPINGWVGFVPTRPFSFFRVGIDGDRGIEVRKTGFGRFDQYRGLPAFT